MAKIKVTVPEIRFRKETMEVPTSRGDQIKQAFAAQQERVAQRLSERNAEVSKQLDRAAAGGRLAGLVERGRQTLKRDEQPVEEPSGGRFTAILQRGQQAAASARESAQASGGGRFSGILRLARQNPEAAQRLDAAAAAAASASENGGSKLPGRLLLLGIGALAGAGVGILVSPTTGKTARTVAVQKGGTYARTAGKQAASAAQSLSSSARSQAAAMRAKRSEVARERSQEVEPETITDRVRTELGEDQTLRHLPRINVNTEPGGVVYLRGPVPSEKEREQAEKIARKQRGVTEVVNEIHIEGESAVQ
jgi:osmotically-inducible protein OsmY